MDSKEFIKKYDNHEKFSEYELKEIVYDEGPDRSEFIEREEDSPRRWSQFVYTYFKINDRYFCVQWDKGLTENQPNEFDYQPYEVKLNIVEKTIKVNEWSKLSEKT